jgi:adenosylmethionine---8-amino-7-oxononanoate aminotransferase
MDFITTNLHEVRELNLAERDRASIWHPLTQQLTADLPKAIVRGEGAYLFDQEGHRLLDLISSWWVNIHGHSHPNIAQAIHEQAQKLEHVIFAGMTHEPAVNLAERLLTLLPSGMSKVFYSDNGSTSVEVAIKMAYQYWRNQGFKQRKRFIAFDQGYHGDTFGCMSVGQTSHFHSHFHELLFSVDFIPFPETWGDDPHVLAKESASLNALDEYLTKYPDEIAGVIIEPLIQASSGMRICRPEFLKKLEKKLREANVLLIYDEVMTGFGRTGDYFACVKSETVPDIICLSKGLTGGFLPMAVTVCQEYIYEAFLGNDMTKALMHSHSFTANPLGCAAALASFELLIQPETLNKIHHIEAIHNHELKKIMTLETTEKWRCCGTMAAFNISQGGGYGSTQSLALRKRFIERGLLIRPIGNVIYLLPPYCIAEADLRQAYHLIAEEIQGESHVPC